MKYGYLGNIELGMTLSDANYVSQQGRCDAYVAEIAEEEYIREQLDNISDEELTSALLEVWEEEDLEGRESNEHRLIWIIGGNISEEEF